MKPCAGCGTGFPAAARVKYCSDGCRQSARQRQLREAGARYYHRNSEARNAAKDEWVTRNPDYLIRKKAHPYGLTVEAYKRLWAQQGEMCAICLRDTPGSRGWCTDHDHGCCSTKGRACGKCVRGILCGPCNMALGAFGDDPGTLRRAIAYLGAA